MKISAALAAFLACMCASVDAQTLYRCGNKYQDRPCEANQPGKAVGTTGNSSPAASGGAVDAGCAQKGRDALKIVWSREGGATLEQLLEKADDKRFVQDVYRRPGAAGQVQAAVQADCMAEKELNAGAVATPAAAPAPQVVDPAIAARERELAAAREAERKKANCARLATRMDQLGAQERTGGTAARMDQLREQRTRLRDDMGRAGC
jgi:hypothetical protein